MILSLGSFFHSSVLLSVSMGVNESQGVNGCFKDVLKMFEGVSKEFQGCAKDVSRVFP